MSFSSLFTPNFIDLINFNYLSIILSRLIIQYMYPKLLTFINLFVLYNFLNH